MPHADRAADLDAAATEKADDPAVAVAAAMLQRPVPAELAARVAALLTPQATRRAS